MNNIKQTLKELGFDEKCGYFIRMEEEVVIEIVLIADKILIRIEEAIRFDEPKITYVQKSSVDEILPVIKKVFWMYDDDEEETTGNWYDSIIDSYFSKEELVSVRDVHIDDATLENNGEDYLLEIITVDDPKPKYYLTIRDRLYEVKLSDEQLNKVEQVNSDF